MPYVPGQGAASAPAGAFPTGLDYTGLGVTSQETNKTIPLGPTQVTDFAAQRGGLAGPGMGPATGTATAMAMGTTTFGQALGAIGNMTPDQIQSLQQDLYQAKAYSRGYYRKGADDPVTGLPDAPTLAAYVKVLRTAYNTQKPVTDVLNTMKANHPELAQITGPDDLSKIMVSVSNPTTLTSIAHDAATSLFGRRATSAEVQAYIQAQHAQEISAQQAAGDSTLGPTTAAPTPSAFAEEFLRSRAPNEAAGHTGLSIAESWLSKLRGGG